MAAVPATEGVAPTAAPVRVMARARPAPAVVVEPPVSRMGKCVMRATLVATAPVPLCWTAQLATGTASVVPGPVRAAIAVPTPSAARRADLSALATFAPLVPTL